MRSNFEKQRFLDAVERIREYIYAGDAFQVVLSQRFERPVDVSGFSIYRGLRAVNPSPYMYYIAFRDFEVVGSSPEPLVTVTGRRAETRPIAGTRPRGATPAEDAGWPRRCWPTRRSGPSTSCSSTWAATTWAGCAGPARCKTRTSSWRSSATAT